MGRPGAGSGGIRHSSSSRSSRPSGGHRVNTTSHRAGSGTKTKPSTNSFSQPKRSQPPPVHHSTHVLPPPPPPRCTSRVPRTTHVYHHNVPNTTYTNSGYGTTNSTYTYTGDGTKTNRGRNNKSKIIKYIIYFVILFVVILCASILLKSCSQHTKQTKEAEIHAQSDVGMNKIQGGTYISDCIKDELGWFDNKAGTENKLKDFFDKTGVQPYILLKSYDSSLITDDEKQAWAEEYYEENFDAENIFLFVYFAEEEADEYIGYMANVYGYDVAQVMDKRVVDIFWDYVDEYWETDLSTDDLFITIFNQTAKSMM